MPGAQTKGSYKGGKSPEACPNLRVGPGGKAYAKSDWATKTNERSIAKQMPLLSEFSGYSVWGEDAERWTRTLYNRHVSSAMDCFIVNSKESTDTMDKEAIGRLTQAKI